MTDKEKEIEEFRNKLLAYMKENNYAPNITYDSTFDIAKAVINLGYGDKKQAVKKFAEKLKECTTIFHGTINEAEHEYIDIRDIDALITELYGADDDE